MLLPKKTRTLIPLSLQSLMHTLALLPTSTWLLHHRLCYAVSTLLIDTLAVGKHFKLVNAPLSNSTHMAIPLNMTVTPLLSFTTFVCTIYKSLVLMTFICTIYIIATYISTIYIVYSYISFFNIYICGKYFMHLVQISHMVALIPSDYPYPQWLSLFLRTKLCCVNLMSTLETMCLFFKLKKINIPLTSLIWFPKSYQHGLPETITTSFYLMLNINTSETLFFHPLLLSGISSVIIFEIRNRLVLLKIKSLN